MFAVNGSLCLILDTGRNCCSIFSPFNGHPAYLQHARQGNNGIRLTRAHVVIKAMPAGISQNLVTVQLRTEHFRPNANDILERKRKIKRKWTFIFGRKRKRPKRPNSPFSAPKTKTNFGRPVACISCGQPYLISKRAEFRRSPILGVLLYLCLHPLKRNNQNGHGITYLRGVF